MSLTIWVDADACPKIVKELIYKTAERLQVKTILVANSSLFVPSSEFISLIVVEQGFNGADTYMIENSSSGDLLITSDIPLANVAIKKGLSVISPYGKIFDQENINEILATRDLMETLRGGGLVRGGPPPFGPKEKQAFANVFNQELTRLMSCK